MFSTKIMYGYFYLSQCSRRTYTLGYGKMMMTVFVPIKIPLIFPSVMYMCVCLFLSYRAHSLFVYTMQTNPIETEQKHEHTNRFNLFVKFAISLEYCRMPFSIIRLCHPSHTNLNRTRRTHQYTRIIYMVFSYRFCLCKCGMLQLTTAAITRALLWLLLYEYACV